MAGRMQEKEGNDPPERSLFDYGFGGGGDEPCNAERSSRGDDFGNSDYDYRADGDRGRQLWQQARTGDGGKEATYAAYGSGSDDNGLGINEDDNGNDDRGNDDGESYTGDGAHDAEDDGRRVRQRGSVGEQRAASNPTAQSPVVAELMAQITAGASPATSPG